MSKICQKKGFTLIELLMVVMLIGVLAALTFGVSRGVKNSQSRARVKAELRMIASSLDQFKIKNGDYPWTADGNPASASSHGTLLFQALTGWKQFSKDENGVTFESKTVSEVSSNGPKGFVELSKLTYAKLDNIGELNPPIDFKAFPSDYVFLDPWGEPYVYLYAQNNDRNWKVFGYHLYSKGDDSADSSDGLDLITGRALSDYRKKDKNIDNIYSGE